MEEAFDVAIVGAGPAGISAACILADNGVKTIVLERGEYPGAKNISGGVLYGHDLAQILPDSILKLLHGTMHFGWERYPHWIASPVAVDTAARDVSAALARR